MEVSFHQEIESLKLGEGEVFHGEGILAVTKALLQAGVTYVGGYQGSPISHLLDVMVPHVEHVLPMIPGGGAFKDIITDGDGSRKY